MADAPRFAQQTLTLVWTLIDLANVRPNQIVVHALDGSDPDVRRQLDALGVTVVACTPFGADLPHCNKLRQLDDDRFATADTVVLCDTDLAFTGSIADAFAPAAVRAKVVDLPNPPLHVWHAVLAAAGFTSAPALTTTTFGNHSTPVVNCNGGLYVVPGRFLPALREAWPHWAWWLIERPELLPGATRVHVDQVAFGLAMLALGLPLEHLPLDLNYPTHAFVEPKPDITPRVLHYHDNVDASGFLNPVGRPLVDEQVGRVNDVIRQRRRAAFRNASFWNFRYAHAPDLGSGIGSRGAHLEYKRRLLATLVRPDSSVLDVGCGDLEVSRVLPTTVYTGVDVSQAALEIARLKRPDWHFLAGALHEVTVDRHDTVICLDVLIHQQHPSEYRGLLGALVRLTRRTLIVSGYDHTPEFRSDITFYHEPLSTSLARFARPDQIAVAGRYRDTTVLAVRFDDDGVPARDRLCRSIEYRTETGRFLSVPGDLISTQFETFGGHTRNELAMLLSLLDEGDVVLDVGAHLGSFAVPMARRVGPAGLVVAVEPDEGNSELLHENVVRNEVADRVQVVTAICSDTPGTRFHSVADPSNTGALHFIPGGTSSSPLVQGIDEVVQSLAPHRPVALVKIDVEGQELSVLRSATRTIASDRPIVYCEVVASQLARQGHTVADVEALLREAHYRFFRNSGDRNSTHDQFKIVELESLTEGGAFFDCLAVPAERVAALASEGRLPTG